jgi:hypothetical protein
MLPKVYFLNYVDFNSLILDVSKMFKEHLKNKSSSLKEFDEEEYLRYFLEAYFESLIESGKDVEGLVTYDDDDTLLEFSDGESFANYIMRNEDYYSYFEDVFNEVSVY